MRNDMHQTAPDPRRWWALALLCGAFFMVILDAAIVTVALAGVPEHESGLASGLSNTAFQMGAAIETAIVATVAVTGTDDYVAANADANPLVALTEGFQSAFLAAAILAGIGAALALLPLGRPRKAPGDQLEPVPATRAGK
jgi:MFS family permease